MLSNGKFALVLGLSLGLAGSVNAQTLITGCWDINTNGYDSERGTTSRLCITSISNGSFTGTQGSRSVIGFWNESAKRISFLTYPTATPGNALAYLYYSGAWFADDVYNPNGPKRLTGTYVAFTSVLGAVRHEFGWTARRL